MAKRASLKGSSGADDAEGAEGADGMEGRSGSGGGEEEGWKEDTSTVRKSFVMKRAWGSMKMVEVRASLGAWLACYAQYLQVQHACVISVNLGRARRPYP